MVKFFFLACLPQTLGDLGPPHPISGQQAGPSGTLCGLGLAPPLGSDSRPGEEPGHPAIEKGILSWLQSRGRPWLPLLPGSCRRGYPWSVLTLGFWKQRLLAYNHLVGGWLGDVKRV